MSPARKWVRLEIEVSPKVYQYLQSLTETGLYGFTVEETAERFICHGIIKGIMDTLDEDDDIACPLCLGAEYIEVLYETEELDVNGVPECEFRVEACSECQEGGEDES